MVIGPTLYLLLIAGLSAERLCEVLRSRQNARRAFAAGASEFARADFPAMVAFHVLFLLACAALPLAGPWLGQRRFPGWVAMLALAAALLAQALRWWTVATLGERWNLRVIVNLADPPVTRGPFRILRHPNYLAVIIEMAAVPMIYGGWLVALSFSLGNAWLLRRRIRAEERALGPVYGQTFEEVPRLLPKIRRTTVLPLAAPKD